MEGLLLLLLAAGLLVWWGYGLVIIIEAIVVDRGESIGLLLLVGVICVSVPVLGWAVLIFGPLIVGAIRFSSSREAS